MNDKQLNQIGEFMREKCVRLFSQELGYEKRQEVKFDDVRCFRFGGEKFAVGVWNTKQHVEPHMEWVHFGDPHMTSYSVSYKTPFEKAQSVMCIASLDWDGKPMGDPRWIYAEAKTAHEYETETAKKKNDVTSVSFPDLLTAYDYSYSFYVDRFTNLTDKDAFCALVVRHTMRMTDAKQYAVSAAKSEQEKKKAKEITRMNKKLSLYAAACQTVMSDEGKALVKKAERFRKLRRAVAQKRVTLAQKVSARMAKTARIISANVRGR